MADTPPAARPAYSRDSTVLRLPGAVGLSDLSPEWAWGGATGKGVRVAVIDSGIERDHPDLGGCVDAAGGVLVEPSSPDNVAEVITGPHGDSFGHGTACAGIIHALAPEARITSVKVLGASLGGQGRGFLAGPRVGDRTGLRRDQPVARYQSAGRGRSPSTSVCDAAYFTARSLSPRPTTWPGPASRRCSPRWPAWPATWPPTRSGSTTTPTRPPSSWPGASTSTSPWRRRRPDPATGNSFAAPHIAGIAARIRPSTRTCGPSSSRRCCGPPPPTCGRPERAPLAAGRLSRTMRRPTVSTRASSAVHIGHDAAV